MEIQELKTKVRAQEDERMSDDHTKLMGALERQQTAETQQLKNEHKSQLEKMAIEQDNVNKYKEQKYNHSVRNWANTPHGPNDTLSKFKKNHQSQKERSKVVYENNRKQLMAEQEAEVQELAQKHKNEREELERSIRQEIVHKDVLRRQDDEQERLERGRDHGSAKRPDEDVEPEDDVEPENAEPENAAELEDGLQDEQKVTSGNSLNTTLSELKPLIVLLKQLVETILTKLLELLN